ncbi:hypothetical protein R1flu_004403 [Riccia fluitans]|uniref:Uncharacterized protein n=1 Tax=Riccia fluitans TaxID=41844 RepID=A0ABD1YR65_9MARC
MQGACQGRSAATATNVPSRKARGGYRPGPPGVIHRMGQWHESAVDRRSRITVMHSSPGIQSATGADSSQRGGDKGGGQDVVAHLILAPIALVCESSGSAGEGNRCGLKPAWALRYAGFDGTSRKGHSFVVATVHNPYLVLGPNRLPPHGRLGGFLMPARLIHRAASNVSFSALTTFCCYRAQSYMIVVRCHTLFELSQVPGLGWACVVISRIMFWSTLDLPLLNFVPLLSSFSHVRCSLRLGLTRHNYSSSTGDPAANRWPGRTKDDSPS